MSYRDNIAGMAEAVNRKYAKYERQRQDRNKQQDKFIDLTEEPQIQTDNNKTLRASVSNDISFLATIPEDKGLQSVDDPYSKYDEMLEPDADQFIINSGATIIRSEITLTDSSGNNKRLVRRS